MSDPFIGQIMQVGFAYAPVGWLTCRGQTLQVGQNQALFALLSNRFGGNGATNFCLPDAQGRAFIGTGQGPGLPVYDVGEKGGQTTMTLTNQYLPTHTHVANFSGGSVAVAAQLVAKSGVAVGDETAEPTAGACLGTALEQDTSPVLYVPAANNTGTNVPLGGLQIQSQYNPPTLSLQQTGLGQPFSIMPPFQAVTTIIATTGIWPNQP